MKTLKVMAICKTANSLMAGLLLLGSSAAVIATDISRDVRGSGSGPNLENGGHFSIGLGAYAQYGDDHNEDPTDTSKTFFGGTIVASGGYRYGGLFIEAEEGSLDGLNLGYTFWNNHSWMTDFVISVPGGAISVGDEAYVVASSDKSEEERSKNLLGRLERDAWLAGAGLRLTGYMSDYIVQFRLLSDIYKGRGLFGSIRLGRSWQLRNWNFYGLASAEYYSEDISDDIYGISAEESTERFPEYHAEADGRLSAKVGVTYPLGEHWVAEASALVQTVSTTEKETPLLNYGDYFASTAFSISYVF